MIVNLSTATPDFTMDEQSTLPIVVTTVFSDGTLRDITGGTVVWKAFMNGVEQVKKDTATMMIMLTPATATTVYSTADAAQKVMIVDQVAGFGVDDWGRPIADLAVGDIINILDPSTMYMETNYIADINSTTLTFVNPLAHAYTSAATVTKAISSFEFTLLPGDTILPATKTYGTPIIYQHMAQISFPSELGPGNIYQEPTTVVGVRGRMFINPILDMS
jgi:hypothetical protein